MLNKLESVSTSNVQFLSCRNSIRLALILKPPFPVNRLQIGASNPNLISKKEASDA